jgi:hypothetical protein
MATAAYVRIRAYVSNGFEAVRVAFLENFSRLGRSDHPEQAALLAMLIRKPLSDTDTSQIKWAHP